MEEFYSVIDFQQEKWIKTRFHERIIIVKVSKIKVFNVSKSVLFSSITPYSPFFIKLINYQYNWYFVIKLGENQTLCLKNTKTNTKKDSMDDT